MGRMTFISLNGCRLSPVETEEYREGQLTLYRMIIAKAQLCPEKEEIKIDFLDSMRGYIEQLDLVYKLDFAEGMMFEFDIIEEHFLSYVPEYYAFNFVT